MWSLGVFRGISAFSGNEEQFRSWMFAIANRPPVVINGGERQTTACGLATHDDADANKELIGWTTP